MRRRVVFNSVDFAAAVELEEDRSAGHGGVLWDSSLALAAYLVEERSTPPSPCSILELGAGCGLPGLVAAALYGPASSVVLTDKATLVPLLARNAEANPGGARTVAAPFEFGQSVKRRLLPLLRRSPSSTSSSSSPSSSPSSSSFDLVLLSDVLGLSSDYYPDLVLTLRALVLAAERAGRPPPTILLATKPRAAFEREFFELLAATEEEGGAGLVRTELRRYKTRRVGGGGPEAAAAGEGASSPTAPSPLVIDVGSGEIPSREAFATEDVRILSLHAPSVATPR
jgi:predicted nicotinamide N-methyase